MRLDQSEWREWAELAADWLLTEFLLLLIPVCIFLNAGDSRPHPITNKIGQLVYLQNRKSILLEEIHGSSVSQSRHTSCILIYLQDRRLLSAYPVIQLTRTCVYPSYNTAQPYEEFPNRLMSLFHIYFNRRDFIAEEYSWSAMASCIMIQYPRLK